jgi:ankyrin repeat protein
LDIRTPGSNNGRESVVKLLLERGADVTAATSNGSTLIIAAAVNGHEPIIELRLERRADLKKSTN